MKHVYHGGPACICFSNSLTMLDTCISYPIGFCMFLHFLHPGICDNLQPSCAIESEEESPDGCCISAFHSSKSQLHVQAELSRHVWRP